MTNEVTIRLGFFFGILALVAIGELLAPRRGLTASKPLRWFSNLGVLFFNAVLMRLLFPVLPVGMALLAQERGWGLLRSLGLPYLLALVAGVVVLDLVLYLQHVTFHAIPTLWRVHMVHHADLDFDLTTGVRFHPLEIGLSGGIKLGAVYLLGPPALAVLIFEVLLNGMSMFNHSNLRLPLKLDGLLRLVVVTPDMHRVHHSVIIRETNSNFGFSLSWWDRLLGTYRAQPVRGHEGLTIGLSQFRDTWCLRLAWMLALPFFGAPGSYPINRR